MGQHKRSSGDRQHTARTPLVTNQLVLDAFGQARDGDPAPAYIHIERCIRLLIADGTLHGGQRLPAVRELAHQLDLAPNTVARAYAELAGEGIIVSRTGARLRVLSPVWRFGRPCPCTRCRLPRVRPASRIASRSTVWSRAP